RAATRRYAVVAAYGGDDEPKQHGLNEAGEDVAEDNDLPDGGPILARVEAEYQMRDREAADQPKQVGDDGQEKQHEGGGSHSGRNQLLGGVGAQGTHGINLFGHDHRAQFAGHAGGVPPGHHQPGDERAQFGDHAERHELADERDPAESLQRAGGVQRQQRTDGESRKNHDGQGADADQVRLLQHVAHVQGTADEVGQRLRRQQSVFLNRQRRIFGDFNGRNQYEFERHVGSGNFRSRNYSRGFA